MNFVEITGHLRKVVLRVGIKAHESREYNMSALVIPHLREGVRVREGEVVQPHVTLYLWKIRGS